MDVESHGPTTLGDRESGLRHLEGDPDDWFGMLVQDLDIVAHWTLHVALYGLQNPTPENIARALYLIGTSGDCEQTDDDTLIPLDVPKPHGWSS